MKIEMRKKFIVNLKSGDSKFSKMYTAETSHLLQKQVATCTRSDVFTRRHFDGKFSHSVNSEAETKAMSYGDILFWVYGKIMASREEVQTCGPQLSISSVQYFQRRAHGLFVELLPLFICYILFFLATPRTKICTYRGQGYCYVIHTSLA